MALKDCSSAEQLVVADRFALFIDRLNAGSPGIDRLLEIIERGSEDAPTPDELAAFLALMRNDVDEPTREELEAMFPKDSDEGKRAAPPTRSMAQSRALAMLGQLERQGAMAVNVTAKYINLWRRQEDGRLGPAPIARISRDEVKHALSR